MRITKKSKNHVFLNRSDEHIVGYMIHLNKNKTKYKKQNNTKLEQIEWNFNILCPTIYKIFYNLLHKMCMSAILLHRIWVSKVYVKELR
jgi:hypothetical protein